MIVSVYFMGAPKLLYFVQESINEEARKTYQKCLSTNEIKKGKSVTNSDECKLGGVYILSP
jgi:hypothetical protein